MRALQKGITLGSRTSEGGFEVAGWVCGCVGGWCGLFNYSVSPVQSFEIWSSTGLSLDNY